MNEKNIEIIVNIVNHIKHFGGELMKGVIAFILSYFFVIDRKKLHKYLE
jgi:predicted PurR-regulated permease PerM